MDKKLRIRLLSFVILFSILGGKLYSQQNVKLICGFEKQEMNNWAKLCDCLTFQDISENSFILNRLWMGDFLFTKGHSSQGEYALTEVIDTEEFAFRKEMLDPNRKPDGDLGDREWFIERDGYLFHAFRWFRGVFDKDWSEWDFLWVDVLSTNANAVIRIIIEESWVASGIQRFAIPAGQYVTIKFRLREVASIGGLDLTDMANIWITLEETDAPTKIYVDNIRLAKSNAQKGDEIPFVTDESPIQKRTIPIPQIDPITRPSVKKVNGTISKALTPIRITILDNASTTYLGGTGGYFGRHERAISAFDDNRLLVLLMGEHNGLTGLYAISTLDGGTTWKGIDGNNKPTFVGNGHNISMRSIFEDSENGDAFVIWMKYCYSGGGIANAIFQRFTFMGDHWIMSPEIICYNYVRHCPDLFSFTKLLNGKLWMALSNWSNVNGGLEIHAMYSDDGGVKWDRLSKSPLVNVSRPFEGGGPFLTSYKGNAACLWKTGWNELSWGYCDGNQWIYQGIIDNTESSPGSVITAGDSLIFIALNINQKLYVLQLNGTTWHKDLLDNGNQGRVLRSILTISGEAPYCFWVQEVGNKYNIYYKRYDLSSGQWGLKTEIVGSETDEIYNLAAPTQSPPNYIPLLYDSAPVFGLNSDKFWVKLVKIPVNESTQVPSTNPITTGKIHQEFQLLNNYPNPFNAKTMIPYTIRKNGQKISLSIYNLNGQLVKTLVDERQESGIHYAYWDAKDNNGIEVSNGLYLIVLETSNQLISNKIIVLK